MPDPGVWPAHFDALRRGENCPMCDESDSDDKPGGIRVLNGRWCNAYLARWPVRPGYAYAIWKGSHVAEPSELSPEEAAGFWIEVGLVASAIERRYRPVKMNWLSLGNSVPHLHVHLVPRYEDDDHAGGPLEAEAFERAHEHPLDEDVLRSEAEAVRALLSVPADEAASRKPTGSD